MKGKVVLLDVAKIEFRKPPERICKCNCCLGRFPKMGEPAHTRHALSLSFCIFRRGGTAHECCSSGGRAGLSDPVPSGSLCFFTEFGASTNRELGQVSHGENILVKYDPMPEWRKEYYENELECYEHDIKYFYAEPETKATVSEVFEYAEVLLNDPQLMDALKTQIAWDEVLVVNGGSLDFDDPKRKDTPTEAYQILLDHVRWYVWKHGKETNDDPYDPSVFFLLSGLISGEFPSLRSQEAVNFLLTEFDMFVKADPEGGTS